MKKFNYTMNHKADEAYMAEMCHKGWAATGLVEGVWTFEPCEPDRYTFRVCYLRGKSGEEIEKLKRELAAKGIEFVSRYSFWAIFRSEHDFALYDPEEELAISEKIRFPMIIGGAVSWLVFFAFLMLTVKVSGWFFVPMVLIFVYAVMCTCLGISYTGLVRRLRMGFKNARG